MSKAYESIKQGLSEAIAYAQGKSVAAEIHEIREIQVPVPDVAAIRAKSGLSQNEFAKNIGVALGTLQGWEQKRRVPKGPSRILLALIDKHPSIVQDVLQAR